jgi:hypothetical protein
MTACSRTVSSRSQVAADETGAWWPEPLGDTVRSRIVQIGRQQLTRLAQGVRDRVMPVRTVRAKCAGTKPIPRPTG